MLFLHLNNRKVIAKLSQRMAFFGEDRVIGVESAIMVCWTLFDKTPVIGLLEVCLTNEAWGLFTLNKSEAIE